MTETGTRPGVPDFPPPADVPELAAFWEATARGSLAVPECPECAPEDTVVQWYPLAGRPCGHTGDLRWRDVPGAGSLYTFTRVERAFLPSGYPGPFTVALVELDAVPAMRLVTALVGPGSERPNIGCRVHLSPTVFETHTLPTFEVDPSPRGAVQPA